VRQDLIVSACLWIGLVVLFAITWNPWWVPTGDSEAFLVIARNLATGRGLTYLGEPAAFVPPGWPVVLAGFMSVGASVAVLKAFQIACMAGGLVTLYLVLRQMRVESRTAVAGVGLAAICSPLYPLTFWLHSDALFVLVGSMATLCAARWARSGGTTWLVACLVLVAVGVTVRWAGAIYAVVPTAVLLSRLGRDAPPVVLRLLAAAGCLAAAGSSVLLLRGLETSPTVATWHVSTELEAAPVGFESRPPDLIVRERPDLSYAEELLVRGSHLTGWFAWAPFVPLRFVATAGAWGWWVTHAVGGLMLVLFGWAAWLEARRGRFLLLGSGGYVVTLCLIWPHVNNRYVVPVLPVVIVGVLLGIFALRVRAHPGAARGLRVMFIAALLFVNGFMWSVDAWVARSPDALHFYSRYEAGVHLPLIEIAHELNRREDARTVAVSERYQNLRERWDYRTSPRVLTYLTGIRPRIVPRPLTGSGVKKLQQWARDNTVDYYVHQNPTTPGRIWHFRLTHREHGTVMGHPELNQPGPGVPQFDLYRMNFHPKPGEPRARWLDPEPVPPLDADTLDRIGRRIPFPKSRDPEGDRW
jgi:hypothetical protein